MSAVVDTDVFSFVFKNDSRKLFYEPHLKDRFLFLSFMSFAELRNWTLTRGWGANQKARLTRALRIYSIQHTNSDICELWAEVTHNGQVLGKPLSSTDAWVAATALYLDIPLITHNSKDFQHIQGLELITKRN